jgi:hypothetical protein
MRVRWFPRLKPDKTGQEVSLLDRCSPDGTAFKIASRERKTGGYEFAYFPNHVELFKYLVSVGEERRVFNEVTLPGQLQKARFDIDLDFENIPPGTTLMDYGNRLRNELIRRVKEVLEEDGFHLDDRNFYIYNSHRPEKYSSHILVDGYYHVDCGEAKGFYKKVVGQDEELCRFVDNSIYSKYHSLRMLWCRKPEGTHYKLQELPKVEIDREAPNVNVLLLRQFEKSLITFVTRCQPLPQYVFHKREFENVVVPDDYLPELLRMVKEKTGLDFEVSASENSVVSLKSLDASWMCPLCKREHTKRNPYLTVNSDSVLYRCSGTEKKTINVVSGVYVFSSVANETLEMLEKAQNDVESYEKKLLSLVQGVPPSTSSTTSTSTSTSIGSTSIGSTNSSSSTPAKRDRRKVKFVDSGFASMVKEMEYYSRKGK